MTTPDQVPDIETTALQQGRVRGRTLLTPGSGTPWEDRGSMGALPAFFKTIFMSMSKPRELLMAIRRPETAGDARAYAFFCGIFWAVGWVLHDVILFLRSTNPEDTFDFTVHGVKWIVHFGLGLGGSWVLLMLISRLFHALLTGGSSNKAPPVLCFNVLAYCMGPSLLAIIPHPAAALVALLWITLLWIIGAASRLGAKVGNAIACVLLSLSGYIALCIAGYYLAVWLLGKLGYV